MRILVAGSRTWGANTPQSPDIREHCLVQLHNAEDFVLMHSTLGIFTDYHDLHGEKVTIVHGGAPGADKLAAFIGKHLFDFDVEEHAADWKTHGKAAGPIRNQKMLDSGVTRLLVFKRGFNWDMDKGGTEHMVKIAMKADIPITMYDGKSYKFFSGGSWSGPMTL